MSESRGWVSSMTLPLRWLTGRSSNQPTPPRPSPYSVPVQRFSTPKSADPLPSRPQSPSPAVLLLEVGPRATASNDYERSNRREVAFQRADSACVIIIHTVSEGWAHLGKVSPLTVPIIARFQGQLRLEIPS